MPRSDELPRRPPDGRSRILPASTDGEAVRAYEKSMLPRAADAARMLENGAEALLERHDGGEVAGAGWNG
ncbi:hypothetical protein ACIBG4_37990 [Nonomuraea sp. NPDC050383]|uniref:hypothetical protein n=1 Tax=Nonomuraea sp. NPDC050383 TaxID=3364362 RepID=UPI0037A342E6